MSHMVGTLYTTHTVLPGNHMLRHVVSQAAVLVCMREKGKREVRDWLIKLEMCTENYSKQSLYRYLTYYVCTSVRYSTLPVIFRI